MTEIPLKIPLTITIIGAGNVATHLSQALEQAGHQVPLIYSRKKQNAEILAGKLKNTLATDFLDFTQLPKSDIYIICVTDSAVAEVMQQAHFPAQSLVVHTAGSLPLAILKQQNIRTGVFYPVQTFSKNISVNFKETPIAIETEDAEALALLQALAQSISKTVVKIATKDREKLHLAAVFACNFTNHLLGISREIVIQHGLNSNILNSLIQTTIQKALANDPFAVQTGPAVRQDLHVLQSHEDQLENTPLYQEIYHLLSESIRQKSSK